VESFSNVDVGRASGMKME